MDPLPRDERTQHRRVVVRVAEVCVPRRERAERLEQQCARRKEARRPLRVAVELLRAVARRPRPRGSSRSTRATTFPNAPKGLPRTSTSTWPFHTRSPASTRSATNASASGWSRTRASRSRTSSPSAFSSPARRARKRPRFGCRRTRAATRPARRQARLRRCRPSSRRPRRAGRRGTGCARRPRRARRRWRRGDRPRRAPGRRR